MSSINLPSGLGLRNILKEKRFLFWDDFRPVEYAQEVIPVNTLFSLFNGLPFEVQVSQSFHDGNEDFEWRRGAVLTAKEQGLWQPCGNVTAEDIRHIQGRFDVFHMVAPVARMKDTEPCPCHMARWIRESAAAHDARGLAQPTLPVRPPGQPSDSGVPLLGDMCVLAHEAGLPAAAAAALEQELVELGALHVRELPVTEWPQLRAWVLLKPLQQRRVAAWLS